MSRIKFALLILGLFVCAITFGQTNTKYQSPLKSSEALYKIETTNVGSASMPGYYSMGLQVELRKWTNIANNTKRFDIELRNDVACVLEKGEWNYMINSLKYIQKAMNDGMEYNESYTFRTSNGIMFIADSKEVRVKLPGDNYEKHTLTLNALGELISALEKACAQAK